MATATISKSPQEMSAAPRQTSLYIADLPAGISQEAVLEKFSSYGQITEIQLTPKKMATVAKITFGTYEEALRVLEKCNYDDVGGSKIHITWHRSDRAQPKVDSENTIEITGLPPTIMEKRLHNEMERRFGHVVSCRVIRKSPTRRCTVFFETAAVAQRALDELTKAGRLFGKDIKVTKFKPPAKAQRSPAHNGPGQLPPQVLCFEWPAETAVSEADLRTACGTTLDELVVVGTGALGIFDTPESAVAVEGAWKTPNVKVSRRTESEVLIARARESVEARTVIVAGIDQGAVEALRVHLETVGPLATFDGRIQNGAMHVRYQRREARGRALKELDRTTFPGQEVPITVLPYFDKHVQRPFVGLLQLNIVDPSTKVLELRQEFEKYGNILAVSLAPSGYSDTTQNGGLYGFILFERHEMACRAYLETPRKNVFLHPALDPTEAIEAFMDSPSAPNNTLAVYDLPPETMYNTILEDYTRRFENFRASYMSKAQNGTKNLYIVFGTSKDAGRAYSALKAEGKSVDVLNRNAFVVSYGKLVRNPLPLEWSGRLLFLRDLSGEWGAAALMSVLNGLSIPEQMIEFCFVNWDGDMGLSLRTGLVLVRHPQIAASLVARFPNISIFKSGEGYSMTPSMPWKGCPFRFPEQITRKPPTPKREWMTQFVALNFPEKSEKLAKQIDEMSISQVNMCMSLEQFVGWIEKQ